MAKHVALNTSAKKDVSDQFQLRDGPANVPSFLWQLHRACQAKLHHGYQTLIRSIYWGAIVIANYFIIIV